MKPASPVSVVAAAVVALSLSACGKKEAPPPPPPAPAAVAPAPAPVAAPVAVAKVTLSKAVDAEKKATAPAAAFAPADTIYAVVETTGTGKASLKAVWTYHKGDKSAQVSEVVQEIDAKGPASTEFHISKPDGWPVGDYQVEIFLDGTSVNSQKFNVAK